MKKYEKIMGVFTTTLTALDSLIEKNSTKESVLVTKKANVLAKASAKADTITLKADALADESLAATKTAIKIREFLS